MVAGQSALGNSEGDPPVEVRRSGSLHWRRGTQRTGHPRIERRTAARAPVIGYCLLEETSPLVTTENLGRSGQPHDTLKKSVMQSAKVAGDLTLGPAPCSDPALQGLKVAHNLSLIGNGREWQKDRFKRPRAQSPDA